MASPFSMFRRNQRVMMAGIVAMSMFAFIFFDPTMMRGGLPRPLVILLIAGLCGLGLWFVGQRHGKSTEWGLWGALLGGVAAFFFVQTPPANTAIHTTFGSFTDQDLAALGRKRYQANQFVSQAGELTKAARPSRGFGSTDNRSMLQFKLGQQEAKRLGISLNDAAVNRFISEITDDKLSKRQFAEALKETQLTEGELFNILRNELEVRLAMEVQAPPYDTWIDFDPRSFQMFPRLKLPATPDESWQQFQRMNVKQSLSAVALPVEAFIAKLEDPAEAELQAFFEARKTFNPGSKGEPGFVQPQRVRLAYLAADFEKFESQAKSPTDEEIAAFYETNKQRYQIRDIPDLPSEEIPADAVTPENVMPEIPAPSAPDAATPPGDAQPEEKTEGDQPAEPKQEEQKKDDESKPKEEAPKKEESSSRQSSSSPIRLVTFAQEATEKTADEKPAEKPAGEEKTAAEPPADDSPVTLPAPTEKPVEPPARFRELDDDLRDAIREEMLRDRAFELMGAAADAAQEKMKELAFMYLETDDKDKPAAAKALADQLKTYALDQGLQYVETDFMSLMELQTSSSESIGSAVLPTSGGMQFQSVPVVDDVFPQNGQVSPVYFPQRADSRLREKRYAWWKIEDKPQHSPQWTDAGIQDQVKTAWKYEKGRQLAQERAAQLIELAHSKDGDLATALAGQTVTGEPGTTTIVITETPRFSWMTTSSSTPFDPDMNGFMSPRLSFVEGVDQPGEDFMQVVFDDLKPGEVGVAANFQRSAFYVVQPKDRDGTEPPADVEGFQSLSDLHTQFLALHASERKEFTARPYNLMMSNAFAQLQQRWAKSFDDRYGVEVDTPAGQPQ